MQHKVLSEEQQKKNDFEHNKAATRPHTGGAAGSSDSTGKRKAVKATPAKTGPAKANPKQSNGAAQVSKAKSRAPDVRARPPPAVPDQKVHPWREELSPEGQVTPLLKPTADVRACLLVAILSVDLLCRCTFTTLKLASRNGSGPMSVGGNRAARVPARLTLA